MGAVVDFNRFKKYPSSRVSETGGSENADYR